MSCLMRVSKRLKGDVTPDDLAGVPVSAESASEVGLAAADRLWNISDFSIFHELQKPIVIVLPGLYQPR